MGLTKRAEKALRESIASWKETAAQDDLGPRGADDCALCRAYPCTQCRVGATPDTEQCPIFALGYRYCNKTPYFEFKCAQDAEEKRMTARAEVKFLEDVLSGAAEPWVAEMGEDDE